jgi:glutamine amidotransferase class II-like protein
MEQCMTGEMLVPLRQERRSDMTPRSLPDKQGLYDPRYEHDACGVGFVVNLKNRRSHAIVRDALQVLLNLEHRGACGCEKNTGDGAGILLQMPDAFLRRECAKLGINLPDLGHYGVSMVFLPTDESGRQICERAFERVVREEGQTVLGWRTVPVDQSPLGKTAREAMPIIRQIFIGRNGSPPTPTLPHKGGGSLCSPSPLVGEGWGGGKRNRRPARRLKRPVPTPLRPFFHPFFE